MEVTIVNKLGYPSQEISDKFLGILSSKLNVDLTDAEYYMDEEVGIWISDETVILDIGVDVDGYYSYYFKNLITGEELRADEMPLDSIESNLADDVFIKEFNKIKVHS